MVIMHGAEKRLLKMSILMYFYIIYIKMLYEKQIVLLRED